MYWNRLERQGLERKGSGGEGGGQGCWLTSDVTSCCVQEVFYIPSLVSFQNASISSLSLIHPFLLSLLCCSVAKSCPTLCDPMDSSMSGSFVLAPDLNFLKKLKLREVG